MQVLSVMLTPSFLGCGQRNAGQLWRSTAHSPLEKKLGHLESIATDFLLYLQYLARFAYLTVYLTYLLSKLLAPLKLAVLCHAVLSKELTHRPS